MPRIKVELLCCVWLFSHPTLCNPWTAYPGSFVHEGFSTKRILSATSASLTGSNPGLAGRFLPSKLPSEGYLFGRLWEASKSQEVASPDSSKNYPEEIRGARLMWFYGQDWLLLIKKIDISNSLCIFYENTNLGSQIIRYFLCNCPSSIWSCILSPTMVQHNEGRNWLTWWLKACSWGPFSSILSFSRLTFNLGRFLVAWWLKVIIIPVLLYLCEQLGALHSL